VRRAAAFTIAALSLLVFPLAGVADVHRGVDRERGMRFKLDGRVLTAKTLTKAARRSVFGQRIDAICATAFRPDRGRKVRAVRDWPERTRRVAFTFKRDVSEDVKWCLLEDGGEDVAGVDFAPPPRAPR
jgi:hypothetical protein